MGTLEGRTAVVTGGSRGIGRGIVERLAREGAEVVFNYAQNTEAAEEVVRTVEEAGGRARALKLDLAESGAAEKLMEAAEEQSSGGVGILVNNAALSFMPAPLAAIEEDVFEQAFAVNTKAAFLTLRYAARHMPDGGRVINISTLNTLRPAPGIVPYLVSKGALEQLTAGAAIELGARGITVNTISPGATDTDLLRGTNPPEALATIPTMTPLGRLGTPADIAAVVVFLSGDEGRWITGQNIRATGGLG
ncbi:SDR family oxidoreductase [Streptomyces sp. NPDC060198]|uniref:SDR family oxidoreductase n=1 Tax=Streptomyces sp. NPDC060198 TaxID=3347070 RepID=UPI00365F5465